MSAAVSSIRTVSEKKEKIPIIAKSAENWQMGEKHSLYKIRQNVKPVADRLLTWYGVYRVGQKSKPAYFSKNFVYCQPIFIIFGTLQGRIAAVFWLVRQISHLPWAMFGFWVWGAPHQLGVLGERCKLPPAGSGAEPRPQTDFGRRRSHKRIWWWQISFNFKPQISVITAPFHHELHFLYMRRNIGPAAAGPAGPAATALHYSLHYRKFSTGGSSRMHS